MNSTNDHDDLRANNAPLDALLHERVGNESPPDLARVVAARHARGEGQQAAERLAASQDPVQIHLGRPLLVAALVLLGIGAVVGTVLSTKANGSGTDDSGANQQAIEPESVVQDPKPIDGQSFSLQVVDRHGGPVQNFRVSVLQVMGTDPVVYKPAVTLLDIAKTPRDFATAFTNIDGLINGTFAVAITDDMHALTLSKPFKVDDGAPTKVTVVMNFGGIVRGTVRNKKGEPIAGATVTTQPSNFAQAPSFPPLQALLDAHQKAVNTKRTAKTDKYGAFEVKKVTYGEYRLLVEHPDYCDSGVAKVSVSEKPQTMTVVAERGTEVFGRVLKGGAPAANCQVTLIMIKQFLPGETTRAHVALTDEQGKYRFGSRVRPDDYQVSARQRDNENPFELLTQTRQSQQKITIKPGQDKHEQNLNLK